MGNTWITNLRHFLAENGDFSDFPGPARKLAEHLCSIVKAAARVAAVEVALDHILDDGSHLTYLKKLPGSSQ
jgi:hypothetical protein